MAQTVLITGGGGFIGSHVADALLAAGYRVRALDNLTPQVHGPDRRRPDYLDARVDLRVGDVRDAAAVRDALKGVDAVVHFAAAVGVGQSMYAIADYTSTNNLGTAILLEALAESNVGRVVVASSMSVYGEGRYLDAEGRVVDDAERHRGALEDRRWDPVTRAGGALTPIPTPEDKLPALSSVYALSKYDQERLCLILGQAHRRPTVALRFFNVYGPRQALSNPYTGVLAIFASRLLNGKPPLVFEDGRQMRDFVHVSDVARACLLALERQDVDGQVFNIGSGRPVSIGELARRMASSLNRPQIEPEITQKVRVGDIRHCFADIGRARAGLGYEPRVGLDEGIRELAAWLSDQQAEDHSEQAHAELERRGLKL